MFRLSERHTQERITQIVEQAISLATDYARKSWVEMNFPEDGEICPYTPIEPHPIVTIVLSAKEIIGWTVSVQLSHGRRIRVASFGTVIEIAESPKAMGELAFRVRLAGESLLLKWHNGMWEQF